MAKDITVRFIYIYIDTVLIITGTLFTLIK